MSRKHYIAIASQIQEVITDPGNDENVIETVADLARGLARIMADDNSNFDTSRFLTACGVRS